jgi:plastocyanin
MKTFLIAAVMALAAGPAPSGQASATVHIKNFAYAPATLTISPGQIVRFVNDDADAHTVTAVNQSFDSTGLDTGDAWAYRFTTPGRYAYFCALHPYMHGTIVVAVKNGGQ